VMLQGAKEMEPAQYREADFAIALDHTGKQGTIIYEAPTYIKFKMSVHGKSVHAGIMPEKGINAIQLLSWVLEKIKFGRLDENTTSNIGFIKGGKATNIVPDLAVAECELRGHNETRLQEELANIERILHEVIDPIEGASFELTSEVCFKHYITPPEDDRVQRVVRAMNALDLPVNLIRTNGGSDVNVFAERGVPGIVLSAGYMEPHSLNERVPLKDMVKCTQVLLAIWEQFARS
jgi:tripeptide aminopeptidase